MPEISPNVWAHFFILFALGSCLGSFINVVVYRLPLDKGLLYPASFCPHCGEAIRASDNLPIFGWLKLRGISRCCGQKISWRYPAVEFFTALILGVAGADFAANNSQFSPTFSPTIAAGLLTARLTLIGALIAVTLIDIDYEIVPDKISLGGLGISIVAAGFLPEMHADFCARFAAVNPRFVAVFAAVFGAGVGAGGGLIVSWLGTLLAKKSLAKAQEKYPDLRGALGWGDIKLLAFFGAFFGAVGVLITFAIGAFAGAAFGLLELHRRKSRGNQSSPLTPFAPFLCGAATIWIFFAPQILAAIKKMYQF